MWYVLAVDCKSTDHDNRCWQCEGGECRATDMIFFCQNSVAQTLVQQVDVWALGIIMYGLLDGRFPFKARPRVFGSFSARAFMNVLLCSPQGSFVYPTCTSCQCSELIFSDLMNQAHLDFESAFLTRRPNVPKLQIGWS